MMARGFQVNWTSRTKVRNGHVLRLQAGKKLSVVVTSSRMGRCPTGGDLGLTLTRVRDRDRCHLSDKFKQETGMYISSCENSHSTEIRGGRPLGNRRRFVKTRRRFPKSEVCIRTEGLGGYEAQMLSIGDGGRLESIYDSW